MDKNSQRPIIAIIGAGSSYTPEIIEGLTTINYERVPVREVRFFDIDKRRLNIMAGLSKRMLTRVGSPIIVKSFLNLKPAIEGVDFVITQIRVGGMRARYLDEIIPLKFGVYGQETTGPGGMFKALRTIPVMLNIAHDMEILCPDAWLLNYTNPSGIITEALLKYSKVKAIGLCSCQDVMADNIMETLGKPVNVRSIGLNHLGFIVKAEYQGKNLLNEYIDKIKPQKWKNLCLTINAVPVSYLKYYYFRAECFDEARNARKTRAEEVMEIEKEIFKEARKIDVKPVLLSKRGGAGYSNITFEVMDAILNNTKAEYTLSTMNKGTLAGIPDDSVVEVTCSVGSTGPKPYKFGEIPPVIRGLIQSVKAYETLTVEAAVTGDMETAIQAMFAHPLVSEYNKAVGLVKELSRAHRRYLPRFFK